MDAREASRTAKAYFEEIHGQYGSVAFQVEAVAPDPEAPGAWIVHCSMYRAINAASRSYYELLIRDDGTIGSVDSLDPSASAAS